MFLSSASCTAMLGLPHRPRRPTTADWSAHAASPIDRERVLAAFDGAHAGRVEPFEQEYRLVAHRPAAVDLGCTTRADAAAGRRRPARALARRDVRRHRVAPGRRRAARERAAAAAGAGGDAARRGRRASARSPAELHDDTIQVMTAALLAVDRVRRTVGAGRRRVGGDAADGRRDDGGRGHRARPRRLTFELRPPLLEAQGLERRGARSGPEVERAGGRLRGRGDAAPPERLLVRASRTSRSGRSRRRSANARKHQCRSPPMCGWALRRPRDMLEGEVEGGRPRLRRRLGRSTARTMRVAHGASTRCASACT